MNKTVTAVFDGQVLHPDSPNELEPNKRYVILVQAAPTGVAEGDAWTVLESRTASVEAPADWAAEHNHYLYGSPKRSNRNE